MKLSKRQLKQLIREAFTEEASQNFNAALAKFEIDFKALCETAVDQITNDGNHNNHEALEFLGSITNEVIADLFETMPM